MRSSRITRVDPKSGDRHPYKRHTDERHSEKRRGPCDKGGRDWSHVATSQEMQAASRSRDKQGRVLPGGSAGAQPSGHRDLRPLACRTVRNAFCVASPSLWQYAMAAPENKHTH